MILAPDIQSVLDAAPPAEPTVAELRAADDREAAAAEADVLRDDGESYGAALQAAGVPATVRGYPGTVHGFWRWPARSEASRRAVGDVGTALRAAL